MMLGYTGCPRCGYWSCRCFEPREKPPSACTVDSFVLLPTPKLCNCGHTIATVVMLPNHDKLFKCPRCGGIGGDKAILLRYLREQQNDKMRGGE